MKKRLTFVLMPLLLASMVFVLAQDEPETQPEQPTQEDVQALHQKAMKLRLMSHLPEEAREGAEALFDQAMTLWQAHQALQVQTLEVEVEALEAGEDPMVAHLLAQQATIEARIDLARQATGMKEEAKAFIEEHPEVKALAMGMFGGRGGPGMMGGPRGMQGPGMMGGPGMGQGPEGHGMGGPRGMHGFGMKMGGHGMGMGGPRGMGHGMMGGYGADSCPKGKQKGHGKPGADRGSKPEMGGHQGGHGAHEGMKPHHDADEEAGYEGSHDGAKESGEGEEGEEADDGADDGTDGDAEDTDSGDTEANDNA